MNYNIKIVFLFIIVIMAIFSIYQDISNIIYISLGSGIGVLSEQIFGIKK